MKALEVAMFLKILLQDSKNSSGWALRYSGIVKGYLFVQELPKCKSFPQTIYNS